jgi:hypothetical protein
MPFRRAVLALTAAALLSFPALLMQAQQAGQGADWHVIAPGVGHAIQLRSGRLLVPVWMALGAPTSPTSRSHRPSAIATIYNSETDNAREVLVHFRLNWLTANQETGK